MKICWASALFMLVFRPSELVKRANADYDEMNTPEVIQKKRAQNQQTSQAEKSVNDIRSALLGSFLLVAVAVIIAGVFGPVYFALGGSRSQAVEAILQYTGIGILLWATLGKIGWPIQTMNGDTIPELVNEWAFRTLYVLGSFLLALAVSLTFAAE